MFERPFLLRPNVSLATRCERDADPGLLCKMLKGLSHRSAGYNEDATKRSIHFFDQEESA
jgi:hypothetical protein